MSRRGMTARGRSTGGGGEGEIDLTPMLDVVFIMLIFFIVTSSFVKEPGIDIDRAKAITTSACERGTIIFAVTSLGDIYYDKKPVPMNRAFRLIQADVEAPTSVLSELLAALKPLMDAPLCASTTEGE